MVVMVRDPFAAVKPHSPTIPSKCRIGSLTEMLLMSGMSLFTQPCSERHSTWMPLCYMFFQGILSWKAFRTQGTGIWFLACMRPNVTLKVPFAGKPVCTYYTFVLLGCWFGTRLLLRDPKVECIRPHPLQYQQNIEF